MHLYRSSRYLFVLLDASTATLFARLVNSKWAATADGLAVDADRAAKVDDVCVTDGVVVTGGFGGATEMTATLFDMLHFRNNDGVASTAANGGPLLLIGLSSNTSLYRSAVASAAALVLGIETIGRNAARFGMPDGLGGRTVGRAAFGSDGQMLIVDVAVAADTN